MTSITHAFAPTASSGIAGALQRIVAGAHWLRIAIAEQRRAARERAEFYRLDERSLRDLGLTRDEYRSYLAEASGLVPRTRLRLADAPHRQPAP